MTQKVIKRGMYWDVIDSNLLKESLKPIIIAADSDSPISLSQADAEKILIAAGVGLRSLDD